MCEFMHASIASPQEREVIMCKVMNDLCEGSLPQAPFNTPPAAIATVVGSAHLPGGGAGAVSAGGGCGS